MVRIAYFGTDGCPGHHVIPIRGKFTEEDIKVIESVDCDDFYKVFDVMRFKIAEFKGWTILGIPASLDDHRLGSKTVIFIEGKANEADFIEVTQEYSFLKNKVKKLAELYHDGEWLATGKLNLGRGLANQIKINKTIPVSHKPKEERRMMFICGDDIASLIKRFENESK